MAKDPNKDEVAPYSKAAMPEVTSSLDSSLLSEAWYDPYMKTLTLTFKNGCVYDYIDVDKETYDELIEAPSAGKYFTVQIKGKYEFLRRA